MFIDKLYDALTAGGWLLVPIFGVGVVAFYLVFRIIDTIGSDFFQKSPDKNLTWFSRSLTLPQPAPVNRSFLTEGLSMRLMSYLLSMRDETPAFRRSAMRVELKTVYYHMEKGLHLTGVLASVAPLMGLLGTVDGMVETFSVITQYGNSNPTLLADGIAEALITTQSGLLIAFPLLLLRNIVEERIVQLQKELERICTSGLQMMEAHS